MHALLQANLGHLESAAGLVGLMKVALMLRTRTLLPMIFSGNWNPKIDPKALNMRVVTEVERIQVPQGQPLYMGINSFGEWLDAGHTCMPASTLLGSSPCRTMLHAYK